MSYIIDSTNPFINIKLTQKGREKLAQGRLNFQSWAIGDSEINYEREAIVDADSGMTQSKILRPVDNQPNIKYFIGNNGTFLNTLSAGNIQTIKAIVSNRANDRGFFTGSTDNFIGLTGATYIKSTGTLSNTLFTGGSQLNIGVINAVTGDTILFKLGNDITGSIPVNTNNIPVPHLFYKIQQSGGTTITLDRNLPDIDTPSGTSIQYYVFPKGEVSTAFGSSATAYWNTQTLAFNSGCDVSINSVPVWNLNNIWAESIAGITGTSYENFTKYGSYDYLGLKEPYLDFSLSADTLLNTDVCSGDVTFDYGKKAVSVLHYTNNTINNFYGEFFHIDITNNKLLKVYLPDLMYHRRYFSGGTGTGNQMGMNFVTSGSEQTVIGTNINYYDLIEDPTLISSATTAQVVGKVYPQYKIIVFTDDEIVATMNYKSNRNWTLPKLTPSLASPSGGTSVGVLDAGKTMYITYGLTNESSSGLTTSLPCQYYSKVINGSAGKQDIEFRINTTGELPYMRKIESSWDGYGFYANNFKILYQIVDSQTDRPSSDSWKEINFSGTSLTGTLGQTISPTALENQNPTTNSFRLTYQNTSGATTYSSISPLNLAPNSSPTDLQFGDERFFYGNIETYIGATIYKTIFKINPSSSQFNTTSNPTRSTDSLGNTPAIRISEVGIYDSDGELVVIGKLSRPAKLESGNTIMLELGLDF
jgi:hypothetical protein